MKIDRIDHVVLTVNDVQQTCQFYERTLGFEIVTFKEGRIALHFGKQKLNLHQRGNEFEPKANAPTPGAVDLCFITETSIEDVRRELEAKGVPVELGPVTQVGALGKMFSVYLRDPDRNLIEIANYVPE
jgi:catechol 2,3-dioxygenase-like lactoylglutathione lyase family enzyme